MKRIRAGAGLGDSIYLQSICRYFADRGDDVIACTDYPDIFRPLAGRVGTAPFTRLGVDIVAHYTTRKGIPGTDQFQDACINAGIKDQVSLRLDWTPVNRGLVDRIKANGRRVLCVQLPRAPMGRSDGFGRQLLPDCTVIQAALDQLRPHFYIVQIGSGEPLFKFRGIDMDLAGKTSVSDLLDVASATDAFLGYVSFMVPIAEAMAKPALVVWSNRGLTAPPRYIRQITPQKVLHGTSCRYVMDNWAWERISGAVDEFRLKVEGGADLRGQDRGDCRERAGVAA